MNRRSRRVWPVAEALEVRALLSAYALTKLPGNMETDRVRDVNDAGHVVGMRLVTVGDTGTSGDDRFRAFLLRDGQFTMIDIPGESAETAVAVNNHDQVLVQIARSNAAAPYLWDNGTLRPVQEIVGNDSPWRVYRLGDLNDAGTIVATAEYHPESAGAGDPDLATGVYLVTIDSATGAVTSHLAVPQYAGVTAMYANESGNVVVTYAHSGNSDLGIAGTGYHSVLFAGGQTIDLTALWGNQVSAAGINESGEVVGTLYLPPDPIYPNATAMHAFVYRRGAIRDLGAPPGYKIGEGLGITDGGQVLGNGRAYGYDGLQSLFVYEEDAGYRFLDDLIPGPGDGQIAAIDAVSGNGMVLAHWGQDANTAWFMQEAALLDPAGTHPTGDDTRPVVTVVSLPDVRNSATADDFRFSIHFTDNSGVDASSLSGNNFSLWTGRVYADATFELVSTAPDGDGHGVTATYRLTPPDGMFTHHNNGRYVLLMSENHVRRPALADTAGNKTSARVLGDIVVDLPDTAQTFAGARDVSVAFDSTGRMYAALFTADRHLAVATRSAAGAWGAPVTVDGGAGAGMFPSIAVGPDDRPAIAYYDDTHRDLKYAWFDGTAWHTQAVDQYHSTGAYPSLAFDAAGRPAIAYWRRTSNDLRLARFDGTNWTRTAIDTDGEVGRFPSLKVDPRTNRLAIAYESHSDGDFMFAGEKADGTFDLETIQTTAEGGGGVSLAFSPTTKLPLVSYYDSGQAHVFVSWLDGDTQEWQYQLVEGRGPAQYTAIAFDPAGSARVFFYREKGKAVFSRQGVPGAGWDNYQRVMEGGREVVTATSPSGRVFLSGLNETDDGVVLDEFYKV